MIITQYMKKTIIVSPHWDDDFLMGISLLLAFRGEVHVIFTSEGDFLTEEAYYTGKFELLDSV